MQPFFKTLSRFLEMKRVASWFYPLLGKNSAFPIAIKVISQSFIFLSSFQMLMLLLHVLFSLCVRRLFCLVVSHPFTALNKILRKGRDKCILEIFKRDIPETCGKDLVRNESLL